MPSFSLQCLVFLCSLRIFVGLFYCPIVILNASAVILNASVVILNASVVILNEVKDLLIKLLR